MRNQQIGIVWRQFYHSSYFFLFGFILIFVLFFFRASVFFVLSLSCSNSPLQLVSVIVGAKERNGEHTVPEIRGHPEVNGFVPAD